MYEGTEERQPKIPKGLVFPPSPKQRDCHALRARNDHVNTRH